MANITAWGKANIMCFLLEEHSSLARKRKRNWPHRQVVYLNHGVKRTNKQTETKQNSYYQLTNEAHAPSQHKDAVEGSNVNILISFLPETHNSLVVFKWLT